MEGGAGLLVIGGDHELSMMRDGGRLLV